MPWFVDWEFRSFEAWSVGKSVLERTLETIVGCKVQFQAVRFGAFNARFWSGVGKVKRGQTNGALVKGRAFDQPVCFAIVDSGETLVVDCNVLDILFGNAGYAVVSVNVVLAMSAFVGAGQAVVRLFLAPRFFALDHVRFWEVAQVARNVLCVLFILQTVWNGVWRNGKAAQLVFVEVVSLFAPFTNANVGIVGVAIGERGPHHSGFAERALLTPHCLLIEKLEHCIADTTIDNRVIRISQNVSWRVFRQASVNPRQSRELGQRLDSRTESGLVDRRANNWKVIQEDYWQCVWFALRTDVVKFGFEGTLWCLRLRLEKAWSVKVIRRVFKACTCWIPSAFVPFRGVIFGELKSLEVHVCDGVSDNHLLGIGTTGKTAEVSHDCSFCALKALVGAGVTVVEMTSAELGVGLGVDVWGFQNGQTNEVVPELDRGGFWHALSAAHSLVVLLDSENGVWHAVVEFRRSQRETGAAFGVHNEPWTAHFATDLVELGTVGPNDLLTSRFHQAIAFVANATVAIRIVGQAKLNWSEGDALVGNPVVEHLKRANVAVATAILGGNSAVVDLGQANAQSWCFESEALVAFETGVGSCTQHFTKSNGANFTGVFVQVQKETSSAFSTNERGVFSRTRIIALTVWNDWQALGEVSGGHVACPALEATVHQVIESQTVADCLETPLQTLASEVEVPVGEALGAPEEPHRVVVDGTAEDFEFGIARLAIQRQHASLTLGTSGQRFIAFAVGNGPWKGVLNTGVRFGTQVVAGFTHSASVRFWVLATMRSSEAFFGFWLYEAWFSCFGEQLAEKSGVGIEGAQDSRLPELVHERPTLALLTLEFWKKGTVWIRHFDAGVLLVEDVAVDALLAHLTARVPLTVGHRAVDCNAAVTTWSFLKEEVRAANWALWRWGVNQTRLHQLVLRKQNAVFGVAVQVGQQSITGDATALRVDKEAVLFLGVNACSPTQEKAFGAITKEAIGRTPAPQTSSPAGLSCDLKP
jgi:hypothetical protein